MMYVACGMLCCMLYDAGCMLYAVNCVLSTAWCLLYVVGCLLYVYVVDCILCVVLDGVSYRL